MHCLIYTNTKYYKTLKVHHGSWLLLYCMGIPPLYVWFDVTKFHRSAATLKSGSTEAVWLTSRLLAFSTEIPKKYRIPFLIIKGLSK